MKLKPTDIVIKIVKTHATERVILARDVNAKKAPLLIGYWTRDQVIIFSCSLFQ